MINPLEIRQKFYLEIKKKYYLSTKLRVFITMAYLFSKYFQIIKSALLALGE